MFYKDMTFEKILDRSLDRISNSIDKRQGSISYDAVASSAAELAIYYMELYEINKKRDPRNLFSEELDIYIESRTPLKRRKASKSIRKGYFYNRNKPLNINIEERFTADNTYFKVIEKIDDGVFKMECETPGPIGNYYEGKILPVNNIQELTNAIISDILIPGFDEEDDKTFLSRYLEYVRKPITSANIHHYRMWAREIEGVGNVKVIPTWKGPNTVLVIIVDNNMKPATKDLVNKVQNYIDPIGQPIGDGTWTLWGRGRGKAPIGAFCTVKSAQIKNITIELSPIIKEGVSIDSVKKEIISKIDEYFKDLALTGSFISYAKTGALIFTIDSILDYSDLKINGQEKNINLDYEETVVLNEVIFNE